MLSNPNRLAWSILITSFVIFCILATGIFLGVRWFLFDSTVPLQATLAVARGTVGVRAGDSTEEAERGRRSLPVGARLTTDANSQGYITFADPYSQRVVATLTLHADSTLILGDTARPRFEFSRTVYAVNITSLEGRADVYIVPELPRSIRVDVQSGLGWMRMENSGHYILTDRDNNSTVLNRGGQVVMINNVEQTRSVPVGMQGRIDSEDGALILENALVDILPESSFDTTNPANPTLPSEWGCYSTRDDPEAARGVYARETHLGLAVLHISRQPNDAQSASSHAETGCLQWLGEPGAWFPVSDYAYLELRATMLIQHQSLSTCGYRGSECPIMVVIEYLDIGGGERRWVHGFYAYHDPGLGYPLRCDTCTLDHERLTPGTWYTFTSGNLFQLLPADQRPQAIKRVGFYASGHEYDVLLSEVAVLAGGAAAPSQDEGQPTAAAFNNF